MAHFKVHGAYNICIPFIMYCMYMKYIYLFSCSGVFIPATSVVLDALKHTTG